MEIVYANKRMQKICSSIATMQKELGHNRAKALNVRLSQLQGVIMLQVVSNQTYPHTPDYIIPVAPGEILEEKLGEMGMSIEQFAEKSGIPPEAVELLFSGRLPMTEMLAVTLEAITLIPVDNWIRYERGYHEDLKKAVAKYGL